MNICYVANSIEIPYRGGKGSGGATHVYEVAKGLVDRGHKVYLLCGASRGQAKSEDFAGIHVRRIFTVPARLYGLLKKYGIVWFFLRWQYHFFKNIYEFAALALFLSQNKCHIVYERSALNTKVHSFLYLALKVPLVLEINDYQDWVSSRVCRSIITPNRSVIFENFRHKVAELPWGANTEIFRPGIKVDYLRRRYNTDGKKVIIIVCCGARWHGLNQLISAAKIVTATEQNTIFIVVGGGDHFQEYKEKVDSLGMRDKFIFTGVVDYARVPEFINLADVAVAPYNSILHKTGNQREFFASPLKVFEYMACAKPVIITEVANKNNIIKHRQSGIVVKTDSPQELADAIKELIRNQPLCFEFGKNALKYALEKYSWQDHVRKLEDIFNVYKN